ncbi:MAG: hypothetical protein KME40_00085 [Komarekiella atlantica HA4396-MV6]|jgi:hypothetical protein|nr:hypothetical protein [Komarekiella atlantica HA4396-MV6]
MVFKTKTSQILQDLNNQQTIEQTSSVVSRQISDRYILTVLILSLFVVACTNILQPNLFSSKLAYLQSKQIE